MRTVKIEGKERRLYGATAGGCRIITDEGDFILRSVCTIDGLTANCFPGVQDLIEARAKDFFPWRRSPIAQEDMPEICQRTAAYKKAMLKDYSQREAEVRA